MGGPSARGPGLVDTAGWGVQGSDVVMGSAVLVAALLGAAMGRVCVGQVWATRPGGEPQRVAR